MFLKYLSLILGALVVMVPLIAVFLTSLKTTKELAGGPFAPPKNWFNLSNYVTAFNDGGMPVAFANTSFILLISITGTVLIGSVTAYAIDRFDFRFNKLVVLLFLLATLVLAVTTQVATFQVVNIVGLFNSRWSAVLLYVGRAKAETVGLRRRFWHAADLLSLIHI